MTSRLLRRLEMAIAAASTAVEAACLEAERVGVLARMGQQDQARAELEQLRQRFGRAPHPAMTGWFCLAEGLLNHLADPAGGAFDRLQRAYALAGAARVQPLRALAAAWLAHAHGVQGDEVPMARLLAEALEVAGADHHAARARACLVAGRAYHLAGQEETSRIFYSRAREHALAEGDDAMVSAILYDMARHRVRQVQLTELLEPDVAADARQAWLAIDSWSHFERVACAMTQEPLAAMLRAQILVAQAQFEEALVFYERHLATVLAQGLARREALFLAELAWCRYQRGAGDEARAVARDADAALLGAMDLDDRALAHARLARVFEAQGLPAAAAQHHEQAHARWHEWQTRRERMAQSLDLALGFARTEVVTTDTIEAVKSSP